MLIKVDVTMTLDAKSEASAENLVQKWITKLADNEDIIEGEVLSSEGLIPDEEFDIPEDDKDYSFDGYPNYPGHPM